MGRQRASLHRFHGTVRWSTDRVLGRSPHGDGRHRETARSSTHRLSISHGAQGRLAAAHHRPILCSVRILSVAASRIAAREDGEWRTPGGHPEACLRTSGGSVQGHRPLRCRLHRRRRPTECRASPGMPTEERPRRGIRPLEHPRFSPLQRCPRRVRTWSGGQVHPPAHLTRRLEHGTPRPLAATVGARSPQAIARSFLAARLPGRSRHQRPSRAPSVRQSCLIGSNAMFHVNHPQTDFVRNVVRGWRVAAYLLARPARAGTSERRWWRQGGGRVGEWTPGMADRRCRVAIIAGAAQQQRHQNLTAHAAMVARCFT